MPGTDRHANISFRGYDVIRNTKFAKEKDQKFCRGLFQSQHKLSKLCRQLEAFGKELLPFKITENSMKFDIEHAIKFLLDKHGLWDLVLSNERAVRAATVDGGELSWKLTR